MQYISLIKSQEVSLSVKAFMKQGEPNDIYTTIPNTHHVCLSELSLIGSDDSPLCATHLCVNVWKKQIVVQWAFPGGFIDNTWAHLREKERKRDREISILSYQCLDRWGQGATPHRPRRLEFFFVCFFLVKFFNWAVERF